ncbi:PLD nuclease N-terminal domain-containing protein [Isoptericola sp. b441]|uniref:PLD nuclease N-terminal domain-containing protein n=1 Tax=Actinotalea lenta TaxID=3064654 RepID=A0ABT9DAY3_9CELL|nr:PLD nuclease N-terminal domain-containing protein [Isoptericola sp. b441]MDO8108065.1 PLD nuclease N-terminal domain-containing protein [Isoptericola sp. b441]
MLRFLAIIELVLMIYALVHCVQAGDAVRNLPRWAWVVLIVLVPMVGAIVYLIAGRPTSGAPRPVPWPATRTAGSPEYERSPRGPDDDPEFLAGLRASDAKHEQMLKDWEAQLREREERLRKSENGDDEG